MGDYNPYSPHILGEELVPIRNENMTFSIASNLIETGTGFTLAQARQVREARFYTNTPPPNSEYGQQITSTVYARGAENATGPVRSVVIPCNGAAATGVGITWSLGTVADAATILSDPTRNQAMSINPGFGSADKQVSLFFATSSYANLLSGKRILAVNALLSMTYSTSQLADLLAVVPGLGQVGILCGSGVNMYAHFTPASGIINMGLPTDATLLPAFTRIHLGEINQLWQTPPSTVTPERLPWRYTELARFEPTVAAPNRYALNFFWVGFDGVLPLTIDQGAFNVYYAALEVIFCEENRTLYGNKAFGSSTAGITASPFIQPYVRGANIIAMRDTSFNASPSLATGDYDLVISNSDVGDFSLIEQGAPTNGSTGPTNQFPLLNGFRYLYSVPHHVGVEVTKTQAVGKVFTAEETVIIPQVSLHATGSVGPLTEVQVYGRQIKGQVYGTITVTQEINDTSIGGTFSYPQVRFYARRFGDTNVTLTFDSPTITGTGKSVTITPTEFDALDGPIIDGWKEVTLRFSSPPSLGAGTNPQWRWSASGLGAGDRWEVMGIQAPAISGTPGNLLNTVPSFDLLDAATYGGSAINMGWLSPTVAVTTDDTSADAVVLFAQDLPAVTGMSTSILTQTLTGIGQNCGLNPNSIPTGMQYVRVAWSPTSNNLTSSAWFGYYELQRMDTVDTTWQSIMQCSSPTISGFSDFEARPGIVSSYRIRAVDLYGFANAWSSTVTATLTAPGATIGNLGDGHLLLFSSNSDQSGATNLAYCSIWTGGSVDEDFAFPEAGDVSFQKMYNRDFVTAFHPTERGGDQFSRTVLVQAAAIAPETLADFTSLRSMAWADVPFICVRDEDGNRWFANVRVPNAKVQLNRSIYMAAVDITEVTDTPTPVDPA
jgi:hypothetical protein